MELIDWVIKAKDRPDIDVVAANSLQVILRHCAYTEYHEVWDPIDIEDYCRQIGEILFEVGGLPLMKTVYYHVYERRALGCGGMAGHYLDRYWTGLANGEWEAPPRRRVRNLYK